MNPPQCDYLHAHEDVVAKIRKHLPSQETLYDLAELYKVFGDSTRVSLLYILLEEELCVCDLAALLGVSVSAVSHQLRILKQARLVKFRKEGKTVFYSLADDHVKDIIGEGMEHIEEERG